MSGVTENQQRAIDLRGNVLVVAGAGTGKTRTLVSRCVEWLRQAPGRNSLDQILMVTFTDAAAAEIRHRIREELKGHLDHSVNAGHLAEQLALIETAFISTLHSFCFRLVRQHFYELDLDPQLSVLPAEEAQLLAEEKLSEILKKHYSGDTPEALAVRDLIQTLARGWDLPVRRLVLELHAYTQTLPDPNAWFAGQLKLFSSEQPLRWREWLHGIVVEWSGGWIPILEEAGADNPNVAQCLGALRALPGKPNLGQFGEALQQICLAHQSTWPRGSAGTVRDRLKDFFREAETLRGFTARSVLPPDLHQEPGAGGALSAAAGTEDALVQDWSWVRHRMITLLQLTREFGREFAEAKRELGVVDFHDLEQFSLRLLWDSIQQRATPLAEEWRKQLRLIFVDEYQDINAAQDAILRALAQEGEGANRFLVGDPKQSIYRFRLADPHIFQEYTEAWGKPSAHANVIPLSDNFRSHPGILAFINPLFAALMRRELGGVAYDTTAWLDFGNPDERKDLASLDANGGLPPVELHLRLTGNSDEEEPQEAPESDDGLLASLSSAEVEARLIGLRLAKLRAQPFLVHDPDTQVRRPVAWGDMVVLLRSPRLKAEAYAKEFSRLGIPLTATRGGFFANPEVTDLLSLLQLLDNPLQDLPMLAVLRSALVNLSLDELALIRLAAKGRFWTALQRFHRLLEPKRGGITTIREDAPSENKPAQPHEKLPTILHDPALRKMADEAWVKVDRFLRQYAEWRRLARQSSLAQCLDRILEETRYVAFLLSQPSGGQQRANVNKLLVWARQFDRFQRQGLFRFLGFIEAQKEAEIDREPAPLETRDTVRLMSIHQSKGLEFQVVVMGDLGKPFNLLDLKGDLILDQQFGLCPMVKPPFTEQRYPSLPYWLAQRRQRRETLGEEMRLLYVAMTRACDLLILAGTAAASALERWAERGPAPFATRDLLSAKSYLDWMGPWLSEATGRNDWSACSAGQSPLLNWFVYETADPRLREPEERLALVGPVELESGPIDPDTLAALEDRLTWQYPFEDATRQVAKTSVSTLRLGILEQINSEEPQPWRRRSSLSNGGGGTRPNALSAAEVGVAHHSFLQFVSLDNVAPLENLQAEARRMVQRGVLSATEAAALDLGAIAAFWQSKIGQEILGRRQYLHREMPFTIRMSLREVREFQAGHVLASGKTESGRSKLQIHQGTIKSNPIPLQESAGRTLGAEVHNDFHSSDFLLVTGVVDLVVLSPEEIWLLDFKTDQANADEWKGKVIEYEPQMQIYALALNRIYRRPVTRSWLHSLSLKRTFSCLTDPSAKSAG